MTWTLTWHDECKVKLPHSPERERRHRVKRAAVEDAQSIVRNTNRVVYINWHDSLSDRPHATVTRNAVNWYPEKENA